MTSRAVMSHNSKAMTCHRLKNTFQHGHRHSRRSLANFRSLIFIVVTTTVLIVFTQNLAKAEIIDNNDSVQNEDVNGNGNGYDHGDNHDDNDNMDVDQRWETADLATIYELLHCDEVVNLSPKKYTTEDWKLMQSTYEEVLENSSSYPNFYTQSSLPPGGYLGIDGLYVPYTIQVGEHGRGIFATQDILDVDTLVWRSIQTARFTSGEDYKTFLRLLVQKVVNKNKNNNKDSTANKMDSSPSSNASPPISPPQQMSCDVFFWAYTRLERRRKQQQQKSPSEKVDDLKNEEEDTLHVVICVDLDPGSFMNACEEEDAQDDEEDEEDGYTNHQRKYPCNVEVANDRDTGCRLEFYTTEPIYAGRELRIDYRFSERNAGWAAFGLVPEPSILDILAGKYEEEKEVEDESNNGNKIDDEQFRATEL